MASERFLQIIENLKKELFSKKDKKTSLYKELKKSGLSVLDALFSSLYIRACEKGTKLDIFHKISKPLSCLCLSAKGKTKRDTVGLFSDSSVIIVEKAQRFLKANAMAVVVLFLSLGFATFVYFNSSVTNMVEVNINGVSVGTVKSIKAVQSALEKVESHITDITGDCYDVPCTISYSLKKADNATLDEKELYDILIAYTDGETQNAYGLYVDNKLFAVVNNKQDITFATSTLEAQHLALTGDKASISNTLDIRFGEYATDDIISRTTLAKRLAEAQEKNINNNTKLLSDATQKSVEGVGDGFINLDGNNDIDEVVISYQTVSFKTVREYVDFDTRYVEDNNLYKGQTKISTFGHKGRANVTYEITSVEGEEVSRKAVSSEHIYKPVTQVVKVGTKQLPEEMNEENNGGKYMIIPIADYYITDRYGARRLNGKYDFHYGLDFAARYGTSIYAAASGEVIYAQYSNSFGYCVKIKHADGTISLYAHCSKLLVEAGDTVSQGDLIAQVGNTGYSFGSHLHFEVITNDERVNPEDYIYTE